MGGKTEERIGNKVVEAVGAEARGNRGSRG